MSSRLTQFTRLLGRPHTAEGAPHADGTYRHLYVDGVTPVDRWAKRYVSGRSKRHDGTGR